MGLSGSACTAPPLIHELKSGCSRAIHIESGATKVIVEVCGDDPDGVCAAKEPNNGFVKMVRTGKRIGQPAFHSIVNRDSVFDQRPR
jgi:hypothetical protein